MFIKTLPKEFIFDCQVRDLAPRTIRNYEKQLGYFVRYLEEAQGVISLEDLKPIHIKHYVAMLQSKNHSGTSFHRGHRDSSCHYPNREQMSLLQSHPRFLNAYLYKHFSTPCSPERTRSFCKLRTKPARLTMPLETS